MLLEEIMLNLLEQAEMARMDLTGESFPNVWTDTRLATTLTIDIQERLKA